MGSVSLIFAPSIREGGRCSRQSDPVGFSPDNPNECLPKERQRMNITKRRGWFAVLLVLVLALAFPLAASARHSWAKYHWARQSNPFTLHVIDSMDANWDPRLNLALSDWG